MYVYRVTFVVRVSIWYIKISKTASSGMSYQGVDTRGSLDLANSVPVFLEWIKGEVYTLIPPPYTLVRNVPTKSGADIVRVVIEYEGVVQYIMNSRTTSVIPFDMRTPELARLVKGSCALWR